MNKTGSSELGAESLQSAHTRCARRLLLPLLLLLLHSAWARLSLGPDDGRSENRVKIPHLLASN